MGPHIKPFDMVGNLAWLLWLRALPGSFLVRNKNDKILFFAHFPWCCISRVMCATEREIERLIFRLLSFVRHIVEGNVHISFIIPWKGEKVCIILLTFSCDTINFSVFVKIWRQLLFNGTLVVEISLSQKRPIQCSLMRE